MMKSIFRSYQSKMEREAVDPFRASRLPLGQVNASGLYFEGFMAKRTGTKAADGPLFTRETTVIAVVE